MNKKTEYQKALYTDKLIIEQNETIGILRTVIYPLEQQLERCQKIVMNRIVELDKEFNYPKQKKQTEK